MLSALNRRPFFAVSLGGFRCVFEVGNFAIKVPRFRCPRDAMRCNQWEREMWRTWRLKYDWPHLCPILYADRFGFVVVMVRAAKDITSRDEIERAYPVAFVPDITAESEPKDWGRIDGRVVALDYCDLMDAQMVKDKRAYYERTERR